MIQQTLYAVSPLECDPSIAAKAFRLNKPDGTLYDVAQTHHGHRCDCPDFIFRRDGLDPSGCKHVKALIHQGLLDQPEERPRRGRAGPPPRRPLSIPGPKIARDAMRSSRPASFHRARRRA